MAVRNFAPIEINDLVKKIDAIMGVEGAHPLIELLGDDIKVSFDLENVHYTAAHAGPKALLGYHQEANGLTYCGFCAGGDSEFPVFFMVYWDGKKLRGYVPTEGNPWNSITKQAFGNDNEKDAKDAHARWPDKFEKGEIPKTLKHDPVLIRKDFLARILPPGATTAPKPPKAKAPKRPPHQAPPRPKKPPVVTQPVDAFTVKTLQERVEALVYYGEDEGAELFQQTCALAYNLNGLGMAGKAEVAAAWAEEMAHESRIWADQHGEDLAQCATVQGHWGH